MTAVFLNTLEFSFILVTKLHNMAKWYKTRGEKDSSIVVTLRLALNGNVRNQNQKYDFDL